MFFKRKILDKLAEWKNRENGSSALLIEGAQRIGKSTVVEEFAKQNYSTYLKISFDDVTKDILNLFHDELHRDLNDFFSHLSILTDKELIPRKSLIIFDKVQFFPIARQSIKKLVKDARFDYIETGSLISIKKNVENILLPSEEERISMYPMDFEEYLWAMGYDNIAKALKEAFINKVPLSDAIHRLALHYFYNYLCIGGMPQSIQTYQKTNSFNACDHMKRSIMKIYEDDMAKFSSPSFEDDISQIYSSIPGQLSKHSFYRVSSVLGKKKSPSLWNPLRWLRESRTVNFCFDVRNPEIGLGSTKDYKKFKIYNNDTGLLVTQIYKDNESKNEESVYKKLIRGSLHSNDGSIFENYVAQQLCSNGYDLYYHTFYPNDDKHLCEVDFIIRNEGKLVPLEVKSGDVVKLHTSFDSFCAKYSSKISEDRYIITKKNLSKEGKTTYLPIYMTMYL